MKINGGHLVVVTFVFFMSFIGYLVYRSNQVNVDLVSEDYYEKELAYQDQIQKIMNNNTLGSSFSWQMEDEYLVVNFPEEHEGKVKGKITFYRPSNAAFDHAEKINTNEKGEQRFHIRNFVKGEYLMQVDWDYFGKEFYHEEKIYLQ